MDYQPLNNWKIQNRNLLQKFIPSMAKCWISLHIKIVHVLLSTNFPPGLIKGLIATEDKDFYNHWGVNLSRFIRQMALNVITFRQAGASTITQQLARNLYKLQSKHESMFDKITRKIREFLTSVQIERNFTKNEILELYLNVAYLR